MARSRKDRLKKKFSGIEKTLVVQDVVESVVDSVVEERDSLETPEKIILLEKVPPVKEISYLDFLLKGLGLIYSFTSSVVKIVAYYFFKPIRNDSARVYAYLMQVLKENKAKITTQKDEKVVSEQSRKVFDEISEIKLNNIAELSVELSKEKANEKKPNSSIDFTEKKIISTIDSPNHQNVFEVPKSIEIISELERIRPLTAFEVEIKDIFREKNITLKIEGAEDEIQRAETSMEFDSTLFEFMAFKMDQTLLINNIDSIKITTIVDDRSIQNTIEFSLLSSGQKWTYMFSKSVLSILINRLRGYQGTVDCLHTYNATKKKETCTIVFKHQRLDSFVTRTQNEMEVASSKSKKNKMRKKREEISI